MNILTTQQDKEKVKFNFVCRKETKEKINAIGKVQNGLYVFNDSDFICEACLSPASFDCLEFVGKAACSHNLNLYDLIKAYDINKNTGEKFCIIYYLGVWPEEITLNETILQVALQTGNGCIITLPRPNRHSDLIKLISEVSWNDSVSKGMQGFLTSKGRFVNREEAYLIAQKSGQIKQKNNQLFSENLW